MEEDIPILIKKQKKVEGSKEADELVQRVKKQVDPYEVWRDPKPWEFQGCLASLREFVFSLHPKLFLANAEFILERIREDNSRIISEHCARQGGWAAVERDIRKAEKWILELYGLEE